MAREEKASSQPQWDFPRREPRSEVIQLPDRQPSYPQEPRQKPGRDPR